MHAHQRQTHTRCYTWCALIQHTTSHASQDRWLCMWTAESTIKQQTNAPRDPSIATTSRGQLPSLGPRPKPTPARIASSITGVILEAIRAGVGLGLGPRLPLLPFCCCPSPTILLLAKASLKPLGFSLP